MRRGVVRICVAAAIALGAASSCRDAAEPFRPTDRAEPPEGPLIRLTYGSGDDRTPVWSEDGDSVYFSTSVWEGNPLAPATVVALPADGMGSLSPLLRNVQEGSGRSNWITAPALSASGDRVAFVRVRPLGGDSPCVGLRVCPIMANLPMVRLLRAELHVRAIDASNGVGEDIVLPLEFAGHSVESDPDAPMGGVTVSEYHPFQFFFESEGSAFFRPAWSPDGSTVVVSDGLRLLRWTLGEATAHEIAGTADGVMPAWSPDGEWIAFTYHERVGSRTFTCEYVNEFLPGVITVSCVERRTIHDTAAPQIVLVRPDGSERIVLGAGAGPAWSPDGSAVYASADIAGTAMIVRLPLDGGPVTVLEGTDRGIEPAVSPDGERVAFARARILAKPATYDIWVVDLP